jgi:hypothetical protein
MAKASPRLQELKDQGDESRLSGHDTTSMKKPSQWFTVIGRELHNPAIVPENVYNMDETGSPEDGRTPLSWAAGGGNEAVVRLLVEQDNVAADSGSTTAGRHCRGRRRAGTRRS